MSLVGGGLEFHEDIRSFQLKNGRTPMQYKEPFIHPLIWRKVKEQVHTLREGEKQPLLDIDDDARVNLSFRLWSAWWLQTSNLGQNSNRTKYCRIESRRIWDKSLIRLHKQIVLEFGQKVAPFSRMVKMHLWNHLYQNQRILEVTSSLAWILIIPQRCASTKGNMKMSSYVREENFKAWLLYYNVKNPLLAPIS